MPQGSELEVFGRWQRLRAIVTLVRLLAPTAARIGPCVEAVIGEFITLSARTQRSWLAETVNATVGETVLRLAQVLRVSWKPSEAFAVALVVKIDRKPRTLDVSRNSQLSIAKSVGLDVMLVEATVVLPATL